MCLGMVLAPRDRIGCFESTIQLQNDFPSNKEDMYIAYNAF